MIPALDGMLATSPSRSRPPNTRDAYAADVVEGLLQFAGEDIRRCRAVLSPPLLDVRRLPLRAYRLGASRRALSWATNSKPSM
jgi:hypothetical protein